MDLTVHKVPSSLKNTKGEPSGSSSLALTRCVLVADAKSSGKKKKKTLYDKLKAEVDSDKKGKKRGRDEATQATLHARRDVWAAGRHTSD